jgi:hypothetical protein
MNKSTTALIGLLAGLAFAPLANAQSAQIGKALHTSNCESAGCHLGTPPRINNNAQRAANSPSTISNAIRSNTGGMGYLSSQLSTTDLADLAAYIGTTSPLPALSDADRLLNWAEWKFQTILLPRASSQVVAPYTIRAYPALYLGVANNRVLMLDRSNPSATVQDIGALSTFLGTAANDGF